MFDRQKRTMLQQDFSEKAAFRNNLPIYPRNIHYFNGKLIVKDEVDNSLNVYLENGYSLYSLKGDKKGDKLYPVKNGFFVFVNSNGSKAKLQFIKPEFNIQNINIEEKTIDILEIIFNVNNPETLNDKLGYLKDYRKIYRDDCFVEQLLSRFISNNIKVQKMPSLIEEWAKVWSNIDEKPDKIPDFIDKFLNDEQDALIKFYDKINISKEIDKLSKVVEDWSLKEDGLFYSLLKKDNVSEKEYYEINYRIPFYSKLDDFKECVFKLYRYLSDRSSIWKIAYDIICYYELKEEKEHFKSVFVDFASRFLKNHIDFVHNCYHNILPAFKLIPENTVITSDSIQHHKQIIKSFCWKTIYDSFSNIEIKNILASLFHVNQNLMEDIIHWNHKKRDQFLKFTELCQIIIFSPVLTENLCKYIEENRCNNIENTKEILLSSISLLKEYSSSEVSNIQRLIVEIFDNQINPNVLFEKIQNILKELNNISISRNPLQGSIETRMIYSQCAINKDYHSALKYEHFSPLYMNDLIITSYIPNTFYLIQEEFCIIAGDMLMSRGKGMEALDLWEIALKYNPMCKAVHSRLDRILENN